MFLACKSFTSQRLQNRACQKDRALSTATQQEAQFSRGGDSHHDKARPQHSSTNCQELLKRNKRTLRVLTNFLKDHEIFARKITGFSYRESETSHEKAEHRVAEKSQAGDRKKQRLEGTPCPAQALPERRNAEPGTVRHSPSLGTSSSS